MREKQNLGLKEAKEMVDLLAKVAIVSEQCFVVSQNCQEIAIKDNSYDAECCGKNTGKDFIIRAVLQNEYYKSINTWEHSHQ